MKTNKFMLAAMLFGAVAMVGCKDKNKPNEPDNGGNEPEEPTIEVPAIDAPEADAVKIAIYTESMCKNGAVMKACFGENAEVAFAAVPDYEGWYVAEVKLEAEGGKYEGKACLLDDDKTVGKDWAYQWSKAEGELEILDETSATAELLDDYGALNKLSVSTTGIVYVKVAKWNASPDVILPPAETAWIKHPWNGGDWSWQEMTKTADATFTFAARYGGNGCNINIEGSDAGAVWYSEIATEDEIAIGDSVLFTFVSTNGADGTLSMKLIEKGALQEFAKVTFNLEIKGDPQEKVFLHGPFVDASWNGVEMTKIDGNHFTIEIADLKENTQYQYTLAADNWDEKAIFEEGGTTGSGNQSVRSAEVNDVVYGFAK